VTFSPAGGACVLVFVGSSRSRCVVGAPRHDPPWGVVSFCGQRCPRLLSCGRGSCGTGCAGSRGRGSVQVARGPRRWLGAHRRARCCSVGSQGSGSCGRHGPAPGPCAFASRGVAVIFGVSPSRVLPGVSSTGWCWGSPGWGSGELGYVARGPLVFCGRGGRAPWVRSAPRGSTADSSRAAACVRLVVTHGPAAGCRSVCARRGAGWTSRAAGAQ
jgi:hypothetical protein